MKTIYIPKGETVSYETLETDRLVVKGCLKVAYGIHAKTIVGDGVIDAQSIHANDIRIREVESGSVICKRFIAEQAQTPELIASECAVVSTFLSSAYVKTGRLTVAVSEVDTVEADEVINLRPRKRGLLKTLILSAFLSLWLSLTTPAVKVEPEEKPKTLEEAETALEEASEAAEDSTMRSEIAKTVREIMEENGIAAEEDDVELKRLVSSFLLLREQGYTLRVLPGTPEENAPVFDFASARGEQAA